jgi:hypothetical protein
MISNYNDRYTTDSGNNEFMHYKRKFKFRIIIGKWRLQSIWTNNFRIIIQYKIGKVCANFGFYVINNYNYKSK